MSISETASAPNALPASTQASAYEAEVKAEQIRLIYTQANFGVIASALIALITAATIHSSVPPTPLLIWLLVMAVVLADAQTWFENNNQTYWAILSSNSALLADVRR